VSRRPFVGGRYPRILRVCVPVVVHKIATLDPSATISSTVLGTSGTAYAQDCYIANRSAQGNAGATHSSRWITVSVEGFAHSPDFPPGVDPDCFVDYWLSNGDPESFTVRSDKVIGEDSANPNLANGKGLEHIEDAYGALLGAAVEACPL
jgi:hypothetical protein